MSPRVMKHVGDVKHWKLVVANIPDKNNGKDCACSCVRFFFLTLKHGSIEAALMSDEGVGCQLWWLAIICSYPG